jgi:hypothetical protein
MGYNIPEEVLEGGVIPNIHITSIDIGTNSSKVKSRKDNPHVARGSQKTRSSSSRDPLGDSPIKSGSLKVDLSMHIKTMDLNSISNRSLAKYLKVLVVQCTSQKLHDALTSNFAEFMTFYINSNKSRDLEGSEVMYKIISATNHEKQFGRKSHTSGKSGVSLTNISFDQSFTIDTFNDNSDVTFLSYFVVGFIDRESAVYDYDGTIIEGQQDSRIMSVSSYGNISSEIVISGGRTYKKSFAFKSENTKEFWIGSKHQMGDGSYMKYATHSNNRKHRLEIVNLDNIKLKDHRVYDSISSMSINLVDRQTTNMPSEKIISEARKDRSLSRFMKQNHNFVSDFMVTRDTSNNARFMFSIDVEGMIKGATDFPLLLSNVKSTNSNLYNTLIKRSKISKLRITRRTLKQNLDVELGFKKANFIEDEESTIIVETSDSKNYAGNLKSIIYSTDTVQDRDRNHLGVKPRALGSLEETTIRSNATSAPVRHFSGSDFDVSEKNSGEYEYVLEMDFNDPALSLIRQQFKNLKQMLRGTSPYGTPGLEQYYKDSLSRPEFYDPVTNQFKISFVEFYNEKYGTGAGTDQTRVKQNFVFFAVNSFVDMLYLLCGPNEFSRHNLSQEDVLMYLTNISSPNSGSPEGINKFIQLMYNLENKLEELIQKNSRYKKYRGDVTDDAVANNKDIRSSSQTSDQKLIHVFDTTYNAATNPSIGFEYLFKDIKERERNTNGLAVFSSSGIVERFDMETRKYFKTNGADVLIVDKGNNEYNTGDNIENTKYSFLSTSNVYLLESDQNIVFSNVNRVVKSPQYKKLNDVLSQVVMHNYAKDTHANLNIGPARDNTASKLLETLNQASIGNSRSLRRRTNADKNLKVFNQASKKDLINDGDLLFEGRDQDNSKRDRMAVKYKKLLTTNVFMQNSDFLSETNSSKYYFLNDDNGAEKIKDRVNDGPLGLRTAPNQIKSLFLSILGSKNVYSNSVFDNVADSYDINTDIFRDPNYAGFVFFNYKNLRRVEVFKGYELVDGRIDIKNPIFEPMKKETLTNSLSAPLLCRHVKYESNIFGIKNNENMNLPTYNEFFIISPAEPTSTETFLGNSFMLNTFYKQYKSSVLNSARRISKGYKKFFDRRSSTTEVGSDKHQDMVRQEYMNSNVVMKTATIFSEGLMSKQELDTLKNKIQESKKESSFVLLNKIKNSSLSSLIPAAVLGALEGATSTNQPAAPPSDSGVVSAAPPSPTTTSSGGSTY